MSCFVQPIRKPEGSEMGHPELEAYYEALPEPNGERMIALRETIRAAIPEGFEETMQYGMPSWWSSTSVSGRISRESGTPLPLSLDWL